VSSLKQEAIMTDIRALRSICIISILAMSIHSGAGIRRSVLQCYFSNNYYCFRRVCPPKLRAFSNNGT